MERDWDDPEFLDRFETCRLVRSDWTHAAHLRLAWLELRRHGFPLALARVRAGIQRFNEQVIRSAGYHDSVTELFVRAMWARMEELGERWEWLGAERAFADHRSRLGELAEHGFGYARRFYSEPRLEAGRARSLLPDLRPWPEPARPLAEPGDPDGLVGEVSVGQLRARAWWLDAERAARDEATHPALAGARARALGDPRWRDRHEVWIFLGTWCADTREQLPRWIRGLESLGVPEGRLRLFALGRDKRCPLFAAPGGDRFGVTRLPTLVVTSAGVETGRITETPRASFVEDWAGFSPPAR